MTSPRPENTWARQVRVRRLVEAMRIWRPAPDTRRLLFRNPRSELRHAGTAARLFADDPLLEQVARLWGVDIWRQRSFRNVCERLCRPTDPLSPTLLDMNAMRRKAAATVDAPCVADAAAASAERQGNCLVSSPASMSTACTNTLRCTGCGVQTCHTADGKGHRQLSGLELHSRWQRRLPSQAGGNARTTASMLRPVSRGRWHERDPRRERRCYDHRRAPPNVCNGICWGVGVPRRI